MAEILQNFGKIMLNMWYLFIKYLAKFYLATNNPLPVLPGNEQNLCHEKRRSSQHLLVLPSVQGAKYHPFDI